MPCKFGKKRAGGGSPGVSSCVSRVVCAAQLRWWRVGVPFFATLVAFPKIDEMDDVQETTRSAGEARAGGQRASGELHFQSRQKLPVAWRRPSKLKLKRAALVPVGSAESTSTN